MQPATEPDFVAAGPGSYLVAADADVIRTIWGLSQAGWRTLVIDRHAAGRKQALLEAFATGLGFPDWFGYNWDALVDLLRQWSEYQPLTVLIADVGDDQTADSEADATASTAVPHDEIATVATLTDIIDDLVVEGWALKLGVVPIL